MFFCPSRRLPQFCVLLPLFFLIQFFIIRFFFSSFILFLSTTYLFQLFYSLRPTFFSAIFLFRPPAAKLLVPFFIFSIPTKKTCQTQHLRKICQTKRNAYSKKCQKLQRKIQLRTQAKLRGLPLPLYTSTLCYYIFPQHNSFTHRPLGTTCILPLVYFCCSPLPVDVIQ